jgi:hypothetical protein
MKSIEFVYWLQGCFEMSDIEEFNVEQVALIEKHLKMVEIVEAKQQLPFCFWLRGVLESQETKALDKRVTGIIKNKLNSIFEHVVHQTSSPISEQPVSKDNLIRC